MVKSLELTRPDQFKAIGDGTRMRILGRLSQGPSTVSELSTMFDIPKGTISHHIGVLEDAGLIRVVAERRVRAVTERRYARVAPLFRLGDEEKLSAAERPDASLHMFPLRHAIEEARESTGPEDASMSFIVRARMPAARARRFGQLVEQLAEEFAEGGGRRGKTYGFAAAIYATDWQPREAAE
ncbi:MAG: ArsR/SmtB family transcription factor [Candidatus Limnocylindria bacterium]